MLGADGFVLLLRSMVRGALLARVLLLIGQEWFGRGLRGDFNYITLYVSNNFRLPSRFIHAPRWRRCEQWVRL